MILRRSRKRGRAKEGGGAAAAAACSILSISSAQNNILLVIIIVVVVVVGTFSNKARDYFAAIAMISFKCSYLVMHGKGHNAVFNAINLLRLIVPDDDQSKPIAQYLANILIIS